MRPIANLLHLSRRIHRPAPHVDGILQANQRRLRIVINLRTNQRLNLVPTHDPIVRPHHPRHAPCNRRHRSQLIQIHMAALFANHLVAMMRPNLDRNQVPHAPSRNKQRRLFPKNLRRPRLQSVHGRVFPINVIANLRRRHSSPHLRRRPSNGIATQIHRPASSPSPIQLHNNIRPSLRTHVTLLLGSFSASSAHSVVKSFARRLFYSLTFAVLNSSTSSTPQKPRSKHSSVPAPTAPSSLPAQSIPQNSAAQIANPTKLHIPAQSAQYRSPPTAAIPKTTPPPTHSPQSISQVVPPAAVPPQAPQLNPPHHEH